MIRRLLPWLPGLADAVTTGGLSHLCDNARNHSVKECVCVHKAALQTVRHELSHFILSALSAFAADCHSFRFFIVLSLACGVFVGHCLHFPRGGKNCKSFKLSHAPEWSCTALSSFLSVRVCALARVQGVFHLTLTPTLILLAPATLSMPSIIRAILSPAYQFCHPAVRQQMFKGLE